MTIAFRPGWTVSCLEAGSTRAVTGLRLDPTEATRRKMADAGLVMRARPGGFALFVQRVGRPDGPLRAPFAGDVAVTFAVNVEPGYWSRYQPDLTALAGPQLYLTNRVDAATVRPEGLLTVGAEVGIADAVQVVPDRFAARADLSASPRPVAMAVATAFAPRRDLPDVALETASGVGAAQIDLGGETETTFVLAPKPPASNRRRVFVSTELAGRGAAGVLELILRPVAGPDPPGPRAFTALFRKRI
jgi:hypothetical protein